MSEAVRPPIGLSTASVYPERVEGGFRMAAELGFDGVEVMVWGDSASQDAERLAAFAAEYTMPILAVHAPCLVVTQRVWTTDPTRRLDLAVELAERLSAPHLVVHPPFRWQRRYADGFVDQVARLEADTGVVVGVENMFPLRADRFASLRDSSAERLARRGGGPGRSMSAYATSYDPTVDGFDHYTLDFSHAAVAGMDSADLAGRMSEGLSHIHLSDATGAYTDEHLVPGEGTQPLAEVMAAVMADGFAARGGQVVLEINTRAAAAQADRAKLLGRSLEFARRHTMVAPAPANQAQLLQPTPLKPTAPREDPIR